MSTQEEEEVENELNALEAEMSAFQLPVPPKQDSDLAQERLPDTPTELEPVRTKANRRGREGLVPLPA